MEPDTPDTTGEKKRPNLLERVEKLEKTIQDQNERLRKQDERLWDQDKTLYEQGKRLLDYEQRLKYIHPDQGPRVGAGQRIMGKDQCPKDYSKHIAELNADRMSLHAIELEHFGELAADFATGTESSHIIHDANIHTDFDAIKFLEIENVWTRLERAIKGFKARYGISKDDYVRLKVPIAPYAVIFAINTRSDVQHLPSYQWQFDKKKTLADMCDGVIQQWEGYISAPGDREYPGEPMREDVEQIKLLL
jgi:hypothetical protein